MNYLAHLFLSGNSTGVRIGNFIGDHVRGNDFQDYHIDIRNGILLHREIDSFTDKHLLFKDSARRLQPKFRKYSVVIVDMFFDHFLAANWSNYSLLALPDFVDMAYEELEDHFEVLPLSAQRMLPHMINHNWLVSYGSLEGLDKALTGLSRRTRFSSQMEDAAEELHKDYDLYKAEFDDFFPQLMERSQDYLSSLQ